MPNIEKISVALTPEMAELVRQAVATGEYASNSEVIRDALREWKRRRHLQQEEIEELRRLWQEGIASGPGRLGDIEAIKHEARRRFGTKNKTA
jgi:antitoxin ParD1/3/4